MGAHDKEKKTLDDLWKLTESLVSQITTLKTSIDGSVATNKENMDTIMSKIGGVEAEMSLLKNDVKLALQENYELKKEVKSLKIEINQVRQEALSRNLIIRGIMETEKSHEELVDVVEVLAANVAPDIKSTDFVSIRRIGRQAEGKVRPVLVEFCHQKARDTVLTNKKKRKIDPNDKVWADLIGSTAGNHALYFDEDLTRENAYLFARARGLKKLGFKYVFVKYGRILGRASDGDKVVNFWTTDDVLKVEKKLTASREDKRRATSSPKEIEPMDIENPRPSDIGPTPRRPPKSQKVN